MTGQREGRAEARGVARWPWAPGRAIGGHIGLGSTGEPSEPRASSPLPWAADSSALESSFCLRRLLPASMAWGPSHPPLGVGESPAILCRVSAGLESRPGGKNLLYFSGLISLFFPSPFNVKNLMTLQCPAEYTAAVGSDRLQSQRFWGSRYGQEWWLWAGVGWALLGDSGGSCGQQLPCPHPGSQRGAQLGEGKGWALLRKSRVLEEAPGPSYPCAHS